ncbi:MAG: alpha-galactosidase [Flavobacteriaceae bacterium]|nr:alpha-galactosidase [Flavobacteriaceae bacterium]
MLGHQKGTKEPYTLASFQGGVNEWGEDYSMIWLTPGFEQDNFQGMHIADDKGEIVGGGMPFIDIWGKSMGVALAHLETTPQWLSLPVKVLDNMLVDAGILEVPDESVGINGWLEPKGTYQTVLSAIIFHELDFYDALHTYGDLLRRRGINIPKTSPEGAYEPYWKSWGFELDFTLEEIYGILPELKSMGINIANLDDGWFDYYGDWEFDRSPGKFPNGEPDMIAFVDSVHQMGFKTNLWWYPLGVSLESRLAKEHPDYLIMDKEGNSPIESRKLYQLCPAYVPAMEHIRKLVEKFTVVWGYDGLYSDTRGLSAVPPCYNPKHNHKTPLESFQAVPKVFEVIDVTLKKHNKEAIHEVCICAVAHSPYNMPYYDLASASDPINLLQTRRRIKVEKAIHGPTFAVGDCYQVPDDEWSGFSVPQAFESAIGTGAQATTFYTDLDSVQYQHWNRWFKDYTKLKLSSAAYTNLYDIAYDSPEVHVVKKGEEIYYGIYADLWSKTDTIELRGLKQGVNYSVFDYANKRKLGNVNGNHPFINVGFRDFLLIFLKPED